MKTAIITLSREGACVAEALAAKLPGCDLYLHADVGGYPQARRFDRIIDLTRELFPTCRQMIYIAPTGLVVRAIAPCIQHKTTDPAVVVVDVGGRWAVSLLSGHEGGANELAMAAANILSAEPVVTTTTETVKTIIAGVGCRRGVAAEVILEAIESALQKANVPLERVRLIASADIKGDEAGLIEAARRLNVPLRFISSAELRECRRQFAESEFVQEKVNLPAVAEPAALLAGRRTRLLLPRQTFNGVTVALAQENCMWSE